jgi:hypothetical protein
MPTTQRRRKPEANRQHQRAFYWRRRKYLEVTRRGIEYDASVPRRSVGRRLSLSPRRLVNSVGALIVALRGGLDVWQIAIRQHEQRQQI